MIDRYPSVEGDDPDKENHVLTDKKFIYEVRNHLLLARLIVHVQQ